MNGVAQSAPADIVVIGNRSRTTVEWELGSKTGPSARYRISPGEVIPLALQGTLFAHYDPGPSARRVSRKLNANCCYVFRGTKAGALSLAKIDLGGDEESYRGRVLAGNRRSRRLSTIPIKVLVDDDEPAKRRIWEARLRERIAAVSDILEAHCFVKLKIVALDTWNTDNRIHEFNESLVEFERLVRPDPGKLAIGFTSQYQIPDGRTHLGGTRGPLHPHILIREWSQHIPEPQRVELVLHEVGHYLGAIHSAETKSVMRPLLLSRSTRDKRFPLKYDPINTLVMCLVGEEIKHRTPRRFEDLSAGTKRRLVQIYGNLAQVPPRDKLALHNINLLKYSPPKPSTASRRPVSSPTLTPLIGQTRAVVDAIIRAADENRQLRLLDPGEEPSAGARRIGDRLTNYYVRRAAEAARKLPAKSGPSAFIYGLGIALDDSDVLRIHPRTREFVRAVEPARAREQRLAVVGQPTMRGRRDLAKHFVVSAYLTAVLGRRLTEASGLAKEVADAHGETGFSLADLAADHAGIKFTTHVLAGQLALPVLARDFAVDQYLPDVSADPEGLTWPQFEAKYGAGADSQRFQSVIDDIQQRLVRLPPYRDLPPRSEAPEGGP